MRFLNSYNEKGDVAELVDAADLFFELFLRKLKKWMNPKSRKFFYNLELVEIRV